jgi:hypothetical protein
MAVSILDAMSAATGDPTSNAVSAGNNRWQIGFIHWREASGVDSLPSLTSGGQAMTRQHSIKLGSLAEHGIALFLLNEAGVAARVGDVMSLTWDNAPEFNTHGIISIQDAAQAVTDSNTNSADSSTQISLALTGAVDGFCIGGYTLNNSVNGDFAWQNSFTEQYDLTNLNQNLTAGSFLTTIDGSVTIDANNDGTVVRSVMLGVTFSPAVVAAPTPISAGGIIVNP